MGEVFNTTLEFFSEKAKQQEVGKSLAVVPKSLENKSDMENMDRVRVKNYLSILHK